jgi:hypothetical protein
VSDAATAVAITDAFERLNKKANDAQVLADKAQAAADSATEKLGEALKASSDEAIQARVNAVSATHILARKVAGDSFTCDSLDVTEIKRAALAVALPKRDWSDKSAGYVEAAFDAESEKDEDEEDDKDKKPTGDTATLLAQLTQLAKDGATVVTTADSKPTPYQLHKQKLSAAHKHTQKGA